MYLFLLAVLVLAEPDHDHDPDRGCVTHHGWTPVRALDGDTVAYWPAPALPDPLSAQPLSVRVRGVDCPETGPRARCPAEAERGAAATRRAADFLADAAAVSVCGWDKYGGRVLGDAVRPDGSRLSRALTADGLCAAYAGRGPRPVWCSPPVTDL